MTRLSPPSPSRPPAVDVALAALCVVAMLGEQLVSEKAQVGVLATLAVLLASAPVLVRRQAPVVAFLLALVALFGVLETSDIKNTMCAPTALCVYSVAERHGRRPSLATAAGALPLTLVLVQAYSPHPLISWGTASYLALVAVPLALGVAAHDRRAYTSVLVERAEAAERSLEEEALRRVGEERLRIARDVHDVVAHAMTTVNVQAGVGAYLLRSDPDQAHAALRTIKQVSGDALTDLRSILGLLRAADDATAPPRPVQRLSELGELRDTLAAAGVDLTVDVDPAARSLPAPVDATGYRIVQEAMTNTLRHAGPTAARIRVSRERDRVVIEVADDGPATTLGHLPPPSSDDEVRDPLGRAGSGNGLRGMRERAAALGGSLEAGPLAGGGWRVTASLPLTPAGGGVARDAAEVPAP